MAIEDPGPSKDSNYSRKYAKEGIYPEAARSVSAKAVSNNIIGTQPWYSEFKRDGIKKPSTAIQRAYEVYMRQSEFKKPYKPGGYTEMETNADPPPGISLPGYEGPAIPSIDKPIIPPGGRPGGPLFASFYVQLDRSYEYGGFCRGNTTGIRLLCQQPAYGYTVSFAEPGTSVTYVSGYGTNTLILQVAADNNEFYSFTINVEMRDYRGLTGTSGVIIKEAVCEEYYVVRLNNGVVDNCFVWAMSDGAVANNIPDNPGTGTVSFPAAYSEIANWLLNSTPLTENVLVSVTTPGWVYDPSPVINPSFHPTASCFNTENAFLGGTWPHVTVDTSVLSPANGVPTCETISETDTERKEWTAYQTMFCSPGYAAIKTDPLWQQSYEKDTVQIAAISPTVQMVSANLVPATMVVRTEQSGESYWYYAEQADTTQIPDGPDPPGLTKNTWDGNGGSLAYMDYSWDIYGSIDPGTPVLSWVHAIRNEESWTKTFFVAGSVVGFIRTLTASISVPRSTYSGVIGGVTGVGRTGSVYGRHSGVIAYMFETLQVEATGLGYVGGDVGGRLLSDWEDNANLSVVDRTPLFGCHAAPSYTEEYADNLDICTMVRDNNLETAFEDLWDLCRTDLGLTDGQLMPNAMTLSSSIRL